MTNAAVLERLAALPSMREVPRDELVWLTEHGEIESYPPGTVVSRKGHRIEELYVVFAGRIAVYRDRGAGPQLVMTWEAGDVTGMLPYSRMKESAGTTLAEAPTEVLAVDMKHFPEMVSRCPVFTAHTVHLMLDRARNFNASELQNEKMISLGRLAAGLAHELNNPASAAVRSAKLLMDGLADLEAAAREVGGVELTPHQAAAVANVRSSCQAKFGGNVLSALAQADREDALAAWLARHGQDERHAALLAETAVSPEDLEALAASVPREILGPILRSIAAGCTTHALARDIDGAATRIHDLVAAVKRFTFMDSLTSGGSVEIEPGLRDTVRVVAAKARAKGASIDLDVELNLPPALASGGELNQVWLNLVDNALDAIADAGRVRIEARRLLDRVIVSVIDDGPGIPDEVLPKIFDPFFTTKAPGKGTGLGLPLSARLVEKFGGRIGVECPEDGGTIVHVTLPLPHPALTTITETR